MTTLTYTTSWSKQHGPLNMLPPLSSSNKQRMVVVHGLPLPANMLEKTSGRPRSRNKSNCYILIYGKANLPTPQCICINVSMCRTCSIPIANEHSYVGLLIDVIQCADAGLQAAMASIKTDNGLHGLRNNFERAAAHLLPYDPVAKK